MLELKNITKSYIIGKEKIEILKNINIKFDNNEFVSILGTSGSGKTTLLNIIGGLDKYDDGDLIIDGASTKNYTDKDFDSYRNYGVGFIFQSYNLIMYQTVLENVMLALTLSGVSKKEARARSIKMLDDVGLIEHVNKKPSELSGGQMQRVAIARALVGNPKIILADEPTGALDTKTSKEIMDLLKKIAKDKIVIMVTHNEKLAKSYSDRIIKMQDGQIVDDSLIDKKKDDKNIFEAKKNKNMSFLTSLNMSFNNLLTKKGRTLLTSFAGSIGIVGIAIILAISNGMNSYIKNIEKDSLKDYPISLQKTTYDYEGMSGVIIQNKQECNSDVCYYNDLKDNAYLSSNLTHRNDLKSFKDYIEKHEEIASNILEIDYVYDIDLQIYSLKNDIIEKVNPSNLNVLQNGNDTSYFKEMLSDESLLTSKYDLIYGRMPTNKNEIVLVVPNDKTVPTSFLYSLNIKDKNLLVKNYLNDSDGSYNYDDIINLNYKLVLNTDYYKLINGVYKDYSTDSKYLRELVNKGMDLQVVGVLKSKDAQDTYFGYTKDLTKYVINEISKTDIYQKQMQDKSKNVLNGTEFDDISNTFASISKSLGIKDINDPDTINIIPKDYNSKEKLVNFIDNYNQEVNDDNKKIIYTDLIKVVIENMTSIINSISIVLIGFIAISLIVSSIMIAIITYISVLERTKEIGILRALGASKKDVKRLFVAETVIEGFFAGVLGIGMSLLLMLIINVIVKSVTSIGTIAILSINAAVVLVLLSVILNVLAGLVPAVWASKKNPVETLRSE